MNTNLFRIAIVASAVFATSQSYTVDTAHAGSTLDLGSFISKHSGKIDSLVSKYGLQSVRDKYLKNDEKTVERRTDTSNSSNNDDAFDFNSLLSERTLRKLR